MLAIWAGLIKLTIYIGNIVVKNRRRRGEKEHPAELLRDVRYFWRMGRDSNPRWSCPHNGFQDRRNRPLCHPSETVFFAGLSNRRFCSLTAPGGAAHHSFALDCADACLADSYARPSQSTALPPIRNCLFRRSFKPTVPCTSNAHYSTLFFAECNRKNCGTGNKHYS